jgi:hypothetical protein
MSTYFSKIIKAGDRKREFNFRQLATSLDVRYSIDVPDEKGLRIQFNMYQNPEGLWKLTSGELPAWIIDIEETLGEAIEENKANQPLYKAR